MWDGKEYTDFASWQQASGDLTSHFDRQPQLRSTKAEHPDLHLKKSSPARGRALVLRGYAMGTRDIDDEPLQQVVNIGADQ